MTDVNGDERKRVGWREVLSGLGLGGVASFLPVETFRSDLVKELSPQEDSLMKEAVKLYEELHPRPKASDLIGSSSEAVHEYVTAWNEGLKEYVLKAIGPLDKQIKKLETFGKGHMEAFSMMPKGGKLAVCGAGIMTFLGSVMLINHFRNKNKRKETQSMDGKSHVETQEERRSGPTERSASI